MNDVSKRSGFIPQCATDGAAEGEEGKPKKKKYKKRKKEEPPPPPPMLLVKGDDGQEYVRMEVEGETILEPMGKFWGDH